MAICFSSLDIPFIFSEVVLTYCLRLLSSVFDFITTNFAIYLYDVLDVPPNFSLFSYLHSAEGSFVPLNISLTLPHHPVGDAPVLPDFLF